MIKEIKMNKEFIPYAESLALKELGFDEPCFGYNTDNKFEFFADVRSFNTNSEFKFYPTAPTFSQAFRWFREKYDLLSYVDGQVLTTGEKVYDYVIVSDKLEESDDSRRWFTYEEAELECLKKLIEIVKNK